MQYVASCVAVMLYNFFTIKPYVFRRFSVEYCSRAMSGWTSAADVASVAEYCGRSRPRAMPLSINDVDRWLIGLVL